MSDAQLTALVLLPVTLIGSVVNWSIVYSITRLKSFHHSFGYLTGNQAVADALHSTTFLLYYTPMVLLDSSFLKKYSHHCGFMVLFCYEMSVHTHFVISLNRLIAAFSPLYYRAWFQITFTKIMIAMVWCITGTSTVLFYEVLCNLFYSVSTGFLFFTDTPFCENLGWYADFVKNSSVLVIIVIMDIATVIRVRIAGRKVNASLTSETQTRNHTKEINFLKQAVFQGFIFLFITTTYFTFPMFLTGKWVVFFSTSFAWVSVHVVDGFVTIICNPDIRSYMFSLGRGHRDGSTVTTSRVQKSDI